MKNSCIQLSRKGLLALVMALCVTLPALAQKITVSGVVSDSEGEPLIGASVVVAGQSGVGVATDFDGMYRIDVAPDASLIFSYVGMEPQTIAVNNRTTIDVTLKENSLVLGEVVAVGYGVVKKSDATGSVAVIKPDDIEAGIATSTQDLLVGASPGVVVTTNGGNPTGNANIRIRGGSSLSASNDPLIVVDGVPQTNQSSAGGTNALSMINPANIESLTILKDASATAIYGSRASNGVIIITTKKGTSGKPQVNFAANWHVNTARKTLNMMDGVEFTNAVKKYFGSDEAAIAQLGTANTDWQKEVLRTSFSQDYSLSVGGTAGFLPYRVNASYTNNQGILKTSGMQRTTVGFNLNPKFLDGRLQINANAMGTYVDSREADGGSIGAAISYNPTLPVRGSLAGAAPLTLSTTGNTGLQMFNGYTNTIQPDGQPQINAGINPLQLLEDQNQQGKAYSSTGNFQVDYALPFIPELHFNLNLGYQVSKNEWETTTAPNSIMSWRNNGLTLTGAPGAGTRYRKHEIQRNTLLDFYMNYRKEVEEIKSNFDVMVGYSWQRFSYFGNEFTNVNSKGFNYVYNGNGAYTLDWASNDLTGTEIVNSASRWSNKLQLLSFFGRFNYIFADTYLLTFTLRDDASSRFSKDNRWGLFPALALGWKISNLPVFQDQRVMNEWKLRLGWGQTGQQEISDNYFPYLPIYTLSNNGSALYPSYYNPNQWITPLYPKPYDTNIKWETTTTWNIGFDLGFLNNRITANLEWYLRDTKDLLARTPVAGMFTGNYLDRNIGSLRNTGFEVTVTARPVVTSDFTWTSGFNIAYNKNKITKLTGDAETSIVSARDYPGASGGNSLQWHMVGEPAFTYRVYQQVYDNDGNPIPDQYVDQNADGVIDSNDLIKFHSPDPKVTMSWNNNFNYKNWDFGITLRANFGNWVYNNPMRERANLSRVNQFGLNNLLSDTFIFGADVNPTNLALSDYYVQNASFVRCDNITIGYTFDNILNNALNLRLFGACQNPFVITKYKGIDPEVFDGIDNNVYPRPITFTLGLVATF